ncbi:hypothetical protein LCGC14_2980870, partial [marine sediment metagenome]
TPHIAALARALALFSEGSRMLTSSAMMAITTSSSISVKALLFRFLTTISVKPPCPAGPPHRYLRAQVPVPVRCVLMVYSLLFLPSPQMIEDQGIICGRRHVATTTSKTMSPMWYMGHLSGVGRRNHPECWSTRRGRRHRPC